ncbi:hypothetical protein Patl1_09423 [Pistacia atlantica]|uniref:Uncharacterized protein n=1 Tax=Pistacia atlantica TaxID=434234 RepID=A0ACC1AF85_9ROSI|nr:hypothetical protein Patl1_09423 [Pistacia atlantica]
MQITSFDIPDQKMRSMSSKRGRPNPIIEHRLGCVTAWVVSKTFMTLLMIFSSSLKHKTLFVTNTTGSRSFSKICFVLLMFMASFRHQFWHLKKSSSLHRWL